MGCLAVREPVGSCSPHARSNGNVLMCAEFESFIQLNPDLLKTLLVLFYSETKTFFSNRVTHALTDDSRSD